jgi:hypothetical protein
MMVAPSIYTTSWAGTECALRLNGNQNLVYQIMLPPPLVNNDRLKDSLDRNICIDRPEDPTQL